MVSVQSNNPYDLLAAGDDHDNVDSAMAKKNDKSAASAQPGKKNVDKSRAQPEERRIRSEYANRGGRSAKSAPRQQDGEARPAAASQEGERFSSNKRENSDHHRGGRGGYQAEHGRTFDRRSGGHRDSEKKESQGWGDATENLDETWNPVEMDVAVVEPKEEDPEVAAELAEAKRLREEEEKQKTLDVYLAEKAAAGPVVALPSSRVANEGADTSQWKDAVVYERAEEENALFSGKEQTYKKKGKKEASAKTTMDIELKFAPVPRGDRTERGGRGGGRGGGGGGRGGRGENKGDRNNNRSRVGNDRSINMDESAFPTLGGGKK